MDRRTGVLAIPDASTAGKIRGVAHGHCTRPVVPTPQGLIRARVEPRPPTPSGVAPRPVIIARRFNDGLSRRQEKKSKVGTSRRQCPRPRPAGGTWGAGGNGRVSPVRCAAERGADGAARPSLPVRLRLAVHKQDTPGGKRDTEIDNARLKLTSDHFKVTNVR